MNNHTPRPYKSTENQNNLASCGQTLRRLRKKRLLITVNLHELRIREVAEISFGRTTEIDRLTLPRMESQLRLRPTSRRRYATY
jgi:hypothetical protein